MQPFNTERERSLIGGEWVGVDGWMDWAGMKEA